MAAGPPSFPGGQAAGDSHLSGFLESGHTRNCSSAGWKVRGSSALSLRSAKDLTPGASRYLPATADGARGPRSAGVSLQHAVISMTALNAYAARFPAPTLGVTLARPRPLCALPKAVPAQPTLPLWFRKQD